MTASRVNEFDSVQKAFCPGGFFAIGTEHCRDTGHKAAFPVSTLEIAELLCSMHYSNSYALAKHENTSGLSYDIVYSPDHTPGARQHLHKDYSLRSGA